MTERRRKFYAWGFEDQSATPEEMKPVLDTWHRTFAVDAFDVKAAPTLDTIDMPESRITHFPEAIKDICRTDRYERALHSYGRSFLDSAKMFRGDFRNAPDVVAYPRNEEDVRALIDWAGDIGAAVIPFGGGSSVVGGVNPEINGTYAGVVTIDMWYLNKILEFDPVSRSARVQAGVYGPDLETQLKTHNVTLRHYPQSFELSTLGGWIATRAAGHYATHGTYIDDYVENIRMVSPSGISESRRLPASGAGPSPDRYVMGTEGSVGIITEAWIRVLSRIKHKASKTVTFAEYDQGVEAVRAISQSGLYPANCRLIDALEAKLTGAFDGSRPILVLGYESSHYPVDQLMDLTVDLCREFGGTPVDETEQGRNSVAGQWRNAFIRGPYYREHMTSRGICRETFETAVCWNNFKELHSSVIETVNAAIKRVTGRAGTVTCRFTHVYPNGPAPYFTFHCLPDRERMGEQCMEIKIAAYDAVMKAGGTITHHHAVGRLHMPWYEKQRPAPIGAAFTAAKKSLDPKSIMNPGVIISEQRGNP